MQSFAFMKQCVSMKQQRVSQEKVVFKAVIIRFVFSSHPQYEVEVMICTQQTITVMYLFPKIQEFIILLPLSPKRVFCIFLIRHEYLVHFQRPCHHPRVCFLHNLLVSQI